MKLNRVLFVALIAAILAFLATPTSSEVGFRGNNLHVRAGHERFNPLIGSKLEEAFEEFLDALADGEEDLALLRSAIEVTSIPNDEAPAAAAAASKSKTPAAAAASKTPAAGKAAAGKEYITLASFNIQVFGTTKMSNPDVRKALVTILKRFSIIFVQEIRDSTETAIFDLLADLNAQSSTPYKIAVSSRTGRSASKEQYAYIYRPTDITSLSPVEYSDPKGWFERPPYAAKVTTRFGQKLFLLGVHISPKDAVKEIDHLDDIYTEWKNQHIGADDKFIFMGDLNAGCSYVTKSKWPSIRTRTNAARYTWIIPDNQVTTTVGGGECPYDRFIIGNGVKKLTDPVASVFNYTRELGYNTDLSRKISDHYPIFMKIYNS